MKSELAERSKLQKQVKPCGSQVVNCVLALIYGSSQEKHNTKLLKSHKHAEKTNQISRITRILRSVLESVFRNFQKKYTQ